MPYTETEEFAGIGIVLYIPSNKQLYFKLIEPTEHHRILSFFKKIDSDSFKDVLQIVQDELDRLQIIQISPAIFNELVRKRNEIICYSNNRAVLSINPQETINELFEFYVKQ